MGICEKLCNKKGSLVIFKSKYNEIMWPVLFL